MKVLGASLNEVECIVALVSRKLYDGNVMVLRGADRSKRDMDGRFIRRCTFSLGVRRGRGGCPGVAASPDLRTRGNGPHGRASRTVACWHAHHDVIEELLGYRDIIVVQTSRTTYRVENFAAMSYASAFENLGTKEAPVRAKDLCECGPDAWPFEGDWYPENPSRDTLRAIGSPWVV